MLLDEARKIELLKYLPLFMQMYKEMQVIMSLENEKVQDEWNQLKRAFRNNFMFLTDIQGISMFENMMDIYPPAGSTLEDRQAAVFTKWNASLPYTFRWLLEFLGNYFSNSDTKWEAILKHKIYELDIVLIKTGNLTDLEYSLYPFLRKVIPANLVLNIIDEISNDGAICYGGFLEEIIEETIPDMNSDIETFGAVYYGGFLEEIIEEQIN